MTGEITREEMVAAVRREAEERGRAEGFWQSPKDEAHWRALQAAQRELEAGGWRSIDDAARNSGEEWLLGTTESDFMVVAFWDDTKDDFQWQTADGPGYRAGAFTHYMPKPRPPTTSDGGKEKLDWSGIRFRGSCTDV